jgi:hypothetical protein
VIDKRWFLALATPALAFTVGLVARPDPRGVAAELAAFDRSSIPDVVSRVATSPKKAVDVVLGGGAIRLRGVDLPDVALSRGARIPLALHFGVGGAVDTDWQVFVHIDARGSQTPFRIHADHWPAAGRYRTGLWQPGEFVVDRFEQTVPLAAPGGEYDVWVGLYRGDTRMPVTGDDRGLSDGEHRIKVGQIVIE